MLSELLEGREMTSKFILDKAEWAALLCFHLRRGDVIADVRTLSWAGCSVVGSTLYIPHERGSILCHIGGMDGWKYLLTTWRAES
jgi:hypothetical protein